MVELAMLAAMGGRAADPGPGAAGLAVVIDLVALAAAVAAAGALRVEMGWGPLATGVARAGGELGWAEPGLGGGDAGRPMAASDAAGLVAVAAPMAAGADARRAGGVAAEPAAAGPVEVFEAAGEGQPGSGAGFDRVPPASALADAPFAAGPFAVGIGGGSDGGPVRLAEAEGNGGIAGSADFGAAVGCAEPSACWGSPAGCPVSLTWSGAGLTWS